MIRKLQYVSVILAFALSAFSQNAYDANGQRTGEWTGYYPDTTLRYEATFEAGKPVGIMKRYDQDGILAVELNYYRGTDRCAVKMFSPEGNVIALGVYDSQKKDSVWNYLGNDGTVRMIEKYKKGNLTDTTKSFYPSGKLSRIIAYSNNKKDGIWMQYFENGDTMMIASYTDDQLHGDYVAYYPKGKVQISGKYYYDLKDGDWKYYSEEEELLTVLKYNKGEILNPDVLEQSYEKFIKNIEENIGNFPDPAAVDGL